MKGCVSFTQDMANLYTIQNIKSIWEKEDLTFLLLGFFFLLPIGRSSQVPLLLMSFLGLRLLYKTGCSHTGLSKGGRWLLQAGLCIFVPALVSLLGSVDPERTLKFLCAYPFYFASGYYIYHRLSEGFLIENTMRGLCYIIVFWALTVVWQFLHPDGIFGDDITHLQGIHTKEFCGGLMLGIILGSMIPLVVFYFWSCKRYWMLLFALSALSMLCIASGTRSAWVALLVVILAMPWVGWYKGYIVGFVDIGKVLCIGIIVLALSMFTVFSTGVVQRVKVTMPFVKSMTMEGFKRTDYRYYLWRDAFKLGVKHPIYGSGVNAFRYAQPMVAGVESRINHNPGNDKHPFIGDMHAHQMVLEAWSGAGVIGIIGLLIFYGMLVRLTAYSIKYSSLFAIGAVLGMWAGFLPFNTHNNFYGSWMTAWFWVWLSLALGLVSQQSTGRNFFDKG